MRLLFPGLAVLLALSFGAGAGAQTSAPVTFTTNLSLGARSAQVALLQQILNQDPDTRVTAIGPGSPGYETTYFGSLTKAAVVRFQTKYASEVLAPAGLSWGNGFVGFYTRAKLNALSASRTSAASVPPAPPSVTPPSVTPPSTPPPAPTTVSQNPNLKNINQFMAALDATASKQGLSAEELATIKDVVMKEVATTTDLRAAFLKQVAYGHQSIQDDSYMSKALTVIERTFNTVFMPERARAAVPVVPFGGALFFSFYCNQSNTWLLTVQPLPPSYATLLTYVPFTQAFLSYNIPITSHLLGYYIPGAGVCVVGACPFCTFIPSWGMITPMVGSSLL